MFDTARRWVRTEGGRICPAVPRVLMVVPRYPFPIYGGLERQAHELSKALVEREVRVQVVSGGASNDRAEREVVEGVPVTRIKWPYGDEDRNVMAPVSLWRCLYELRESFDVIHLHNLSWFGAITIVGAKFLGKPILAKLPNFGDRGLPYVESGPGGFVKIRAFMSADAFVAMCPESVDELRERHFDARRVFRVSNGIRVSPETADPLERRGKSEAIRFVFMGRLLPQKGLMDLLAAWPGVVAAAGCPVRLDLFGDGPQKEELQQTIQRLNISGSADLKGFTDNASREIAAADVLVIPSYIEGNPNAVLEAMACGRPIVGTRLGGTSLLVGPAGRAWLSAPGDRDALARSLVEIAKDDAVRVRLGAAMHERAKKFFSFDTVASLYMNVYRLLSEGRRNEISTVVSPVFREDGSL